MMRALVNSLPWGDGARQSLRNLLRNRRRIQTNSTANSGAAAAAPTPGPAAGGSLWAHIPTKAAITSGSLALVGDLIAQALQAHTAPQDKPHEFDAVRLGRMGLWGFVFYGPYQHYWYRALDKQWPGRSIGNFFTKVAMNQLCLAPVVLLSVFSWNLWMQGTPSLIPEKVKRDLFPTMVNGWKFWVPAASINFYFIPLQYQVVYMSSCGVLWSAYLSYSSYNVMKQQTAAAPAVTASKEEKDKKKK